MRIAALMLICVSAFAQSNPDYQPSWEIGIAGSAMITHSSPVVGTVDANFTGGVFLGQSRHNYIGGIAGSSVAFGSGSTVGSLLYGGEYRYLIGSSKVQPFVGGAVGGETVFANCGGCTVTDGLLAPEFGVRFYATPQSIFEIGYQLPILFGSHTSGATFGQRSASLVTFGFRHDFLRLRPNPVQPTAQAPAPVQPRAAAPPPAAQPSVRPITPARPTVLTDADIVGMSQAGVSDEIIIGLINAGSTTFQLQPSDLIKLRSDGVSNAVIQAMINHR